MTPNQQVLSDEQIIDLAVKHNLGRKLRPLGPHDTGSVFYTDAGYRTSELFQFADAIESATLAALAQQAQEPVRVLDRHQKRMVPGISDQQRATINAAYTTPQPQPVPAPVDERKAFEASMRKKHGWEDRDFKSDSFGYFDGHTATAWLGWQDRAALQSPAPQTKGQP